jgi:hypothetical protein
LRRPIISEASLVRQRLDVSKGTMSNFPTEILSAERIEALEQEIIKEAEAGRKEAAWNKLQPLRIAQHHQREAANSLLRIVGGQCLPREGAVDILLELE